MAAAARHRHKETAGGICPSPGCWRRLTPGAKTCSEHGPWAATEIIVVARRNAMLDDITIALKARMRRDSMSMSACERAILLSAGLPVPGVVNAGGTSLLSQIMTPARRGLPGRARFDAVLSWLEFSESAIAQLRDEWDACAEGLNVGAKVKLGLAEIERPRCRLHGCTNRVPSAEAEYCSRGHAYEDRQPGRPKEPFARFMYDEWRASGKSQRSFAVFLGLSPTTLSLLLNGRIRTVTRLTAENLRQVFGDCMPEPPQLRGMAKITNQSSARSPEWRQRMKEITVEQAAGPEWVEQVEVLRRYASSETGRLERAMGHELRRWAESAGLSFRNGVLRDPVTGRDSRPTNRGLAAMATRIADRRGRDRHEVLALLRPMLDRRALWQRGVAGTGRRRKPPEAAGALRASHIELVRAALRSRLVLSRSEVVSMFGENRSNAYLDQLRAFMVEQGVLEVGRVTTEGGGRLEVWALPGHTP